MTIDPDLFYLCWQDGPVDGRGQYYVLRGHFLINNPDKTIKVFRAVDHRVYNLDKILALSRLANRFSD